MRLGLIKSWGMSAAARKSAFSKPPEVGGFGNLDSDGFRITRRDGSCGEGGRHWFDAQAIVLCLNVSGRGQFRAEEGRGCAVEPGSVILSTAPGNRQLLERTAGEKHRFIAMEMRRPWVSRWLPPDAEGLRSPVALFLKPGRGNKSACESRPMTAQMAQLAADVLQPPGARAAWTCWHHAKALEMISHGMLASEETELFCERTKRLGRERTTRVQKILLADLENPPPLAELGRMVGCSPFYLSRMFRQETGVTISNFLRRARMDRAAELLRAGDANVTEAAMTVGYSSLSHFSKAFAETFGCCPCLYGRKA